MLATPTLNDVREFLNKDLEPGDSKLAGLVFAPRNDPAMNEILNVLPEFHWRFGADVHFFFAGWMRGEPVRPEDAIEMRAPDGCEPPWLYSAMARDIMLRDVEAKSSYRWSGETDIVLCDAEKSDSGDVTYLQISQALVLNVAKLLRDDATPSIGALLEEIARAGARSTGTAGFAARNQAKGLGQSTAQYIIDRIPLNLGHGIKRASYYRLLNLTK